MPTWLCKIGLGGLAIALLRWVIREDLWTELAEPGARAIGKPYVGLHTPDTDPTR